MDLNLDKEIDLFGGSYDDDAIVKMILNQNTPEKAMFKLNQEIDKYNFHLNQFGYTPDDLQRMKRMRRAYNTIQNQL